MIHFFDFYLCVLCVHTAWNKNEELENVYCLSLYFSISDLHSVSLSLYIYTGTSL